MATMSLARKGAIIVGAAVALATLTQSANAYWRGGCWGCGAFAAGAIAGAGWRAHIIPPSTMPRLSSPLRPSSWLRLLFTHIRFARPFLPIPTTAAKRLPKPARPDWARSI